MSRLHPASAAMSALRSGGQLALFAAFASTAFLGMGGDGAAPLTPLAIPAAFALGAGIALARWYRFEYETLPDRLVVRSGVVSRQDREIPLHRVQNVDVRRSVIQRAIGLSTVTVETAGGGSTEATLNAVGREEAGRLREELGRRGRRSEQREESDRPDSAEGSTDAAGPDATGAGGADDTAVAADRDAEGTSERRRSEPESETLYELAGRRFATLCAVSFRPSAVIAPFVGASLFDDLLFDGGRLLVRYGIIDVDLGPGDVPSPGTGNALSLALLGVVGFLLVVWAVSAALTFVRYYGFRLERVGDELRYERGLLGRYSGTVPLSKVQTLTVSENAAMRRLGYASLAVETAGYAPGSGGGGGGGGVETTVPLDSRERVVALADEIRGELGTDAETGPAPADDAFGTGTVDGPPTRARRRYVARYALAALALTAVAVGVDRLAFDLPRFLPFAPLIGVALAPIAGHLMWTHRGYATVSDGFVTRTGVFRRHTRLVPYFRLQTVFVSQTVFQRRRNLASVVGDSASSSGLLGGDAVAHDLDADAADGLREELLDDLRGDLAARRRARSDRLRRDLADDPDGDETVPQGGAENVTTQSNGSAGDSADQSGEDSGDPVDRGVRDDRESFAWADVDSSDSGDPGGDDQGDGSTGDR